MAVDETFEKHHRPFDRNAWVKSNKNVFRVKPQLPYLQILESRRSCLNANRRKSDLHLGKIDFDLKVCCLPLST